MARTGRRPRVRPGASANGYGGGSGRVHGRGLARRERGNRPDRAGEALESIVELFESGDLPAAIARTWIARQEGTSPMVNWSLGNQLLCLLAGSTDCRGFRQWKEAGRSVTKGSHAVWILAPIVRRIEDEETGETRPVCVGFKSIPVFRYEDTEGHPIERPDYDPPEPPPLADVARSWGIHVDYVPMIGQGWLGQYYAAGESITLATHEARTFFHELAHAAHSRVLRSRGGGLKGGQVASQEIVAELVAAALVRLHGGSMGDVAYSRDYVAAYAKGKTPGQAAMRVLADAQACLTLILDTDEAAEGFAAAAREVAA